MRTVSLRGTLGSGATMRDRITLTQLLAALAQLNEGGGGNLEQVAWELDVEPERIGETWQEALRAGLVQPVAVDEPAEGRVRLTPGGWAALSEASSRRELTPVASRGHCARRRA